jgi:hypothetical protein
MLLRRKKLSPTKMAYYLPTSTVLVPSAPIRTYVYEPAIIPNIYSSDVIVNAYDRALQYSKFLELTESEKLYNQALRDKVNEQIFNHEVKKKVEKEILERELLEHELKVKKALIDSHYTCHGNCHICTNVCHSRIRAHYCDPHCDHHYCCSNTCHKTRCCTKCHHC